ncbi:MAG TPA: transposase [Acetobacteraceae bacterium]|nr:transposase [Acetobacteraceae bacterium]
MELAEPKTVADAIRYFSDSDVALQAMVRLRWPSGVVCPICGAGNPTFLAKQHRWQCKSKHPGRQFSAKTGTVMEGSPLSLGVWFSAIWLICNAKNGVSSYEIHRSLGIMQKSAWFLLHRIRMAMRTGSFEMSDNKGGDPGADPDAGPNPEAKAKTPAELEADETFIGGKRKNMHKARKEKLGKGRGTIGKEIVMGILAREVGAVVNGGNKRYTDALRSYSGLGADYLHEAVDHEIEYVRGRVHTHGMENFWSLLKRGLNGTYTHMSASYLDRYVDEQAFRFNERHRNDSERFRAVVSSVQGKRLTYRELTGRSTEGSKD